MAFSSSRIVRFSLSKALTESQNWAVDSFPAIIHRGTGYSERWALLEHTRDVETGAYIWRYEVQGVPDIDIVVDHVIHELTDAVLLDEWHSVSEDRFTFGSMRRDSPPRHSEEVNQAPAEDPSTRSGQARSPSSG